MDLISIIIVGALCAVAALYFAYRIISGSKKSGEPLTQTLHSSIEEMRAVGELTVYRAYTKEIATQTDHSWGEFGAKYLSWVVSEKKMAIIFEFEIGFTYDLMDAQFQIKAQAQPNHYLFTMPQAQCDVNIKSIRFYDEQNAKVLPWLLPDIVNQAFTGAFSQQDKNQLVEAAHAHASQQAHELVKKLRPEVETSAKTTLGALARSFGAQQVSFAFLGEDSIRMDVQYNATETVDKSEQPQPMAKVG